jgi:hypothetical protein
MTHGCHHGHGPPVVICARSSSADVVLALDGSFNQHATALVVCQLGDPPHLDVAGLWEPPPGSTDWRAPVLEVEQRIRDCWLRWSVRTILADPFRRNRSVQLPAEEAYPYKSFRKARSG